jgi:hypothetical protein
MNHKKLLDTIKDRWTTFEEGKVIIEGSAGYLQMRFVGIIENGEVVQITEMIERNKNCQNPFEFSTPNVIWEK